MEQDGYEVGVAKTKEALRVEVSKICRYYCLQVWNEALNQARVEASSAFKRVESAYYPPAIQASGSSGPKVDAASKEVGTRKESPAKALPSIQSLPKEVELLAGAEKPAEVTKEVANDAILPPVDPKDPSKEKEAPHNMETVLATLPIPTKEDPKGKGLTSSTTAITQPSKTPKEKLVIKMKP